MLPKRADPVAGALIGTIVLAALLATPLLIVALIVWTVVRAGRNAPQPEDDSGFTSRFQELEESILDANAADAPGKKLARKRRHRAIR